MPADLKAKCPFYGFYKKTPENPGHLSVAPATILT